MRRAKGTILIFTFKDGILARAAHDLQLHFDSFEITLEGDDVRGEFPLTAIVVDGPVEGGVVHREQYDAGKKADVQKAMRGEVLHIDKHPVSRFVGKAVASGAGFNVEGKLELGGQTAPLSFQVRNEGGTYRAQIDIQPSQWGIAQYKALLGAIRLKDTVRIDIALTEA